MTRRDPPLTRDKLVLAIGEAVLEIIEGHARAPAQPKTANKRETTWNAKGPRRRAASSTGR